MGMMLDDLEQKLFYRLVCEELKSYGFDEHGIQVSGKVKQSDLAYVRLLLSSLTRIQKSVVREEARKKRISQAIQKIENKDQGNQGDTG